MLARMALLGLALGLGGCAATLAGKIDPAFDSPYVLDSGDRLRVVVFGQDGLSNSYAVDAAGKISMPLISEVEARGRTTEELARVIAGRLRAGYVREPHVAVEVDAYRPFFVLGEVTAAGQYAFVNGLTVEKAIAVAGGYSPRAQRNGAVVARVIRGQLVHEAVPLSFPVRPGDTITVEERWF
jgi:polysaccharide export outer membrane protein